jgi:hypothetical protein
MARKRTLAGIAVAGAVVTGAVLTMASGPVRTDPVAFRTPVPSGIPDAAKLVTIGHVPAGWHEDRSVQFPLPGLDLLPARPGPAGVRAWQVGYLPPVRQSGTGLLILVETGQVGLDSVRHDVDVDGSFVPLAVSRGTAIQRTPPGMLVVWQPRPRLVIAIEAAGIPDTELLAVLRGISVGT